MMPVNGEGNYPSFLSLFKYKLIFLKMHDKIMDWSININMYLDKFKLVVDS